MPGRVLNFLEFSDKYSNEADEPLNIDDMKNASSNFEEGFDEETYNYPQIGANRPISGEYEMTPSMPGEGETPSFSEENSKDMKAPEKIEPTKDDDVESEEEKDVNDEEYEEDSVEDESEEGNPEAGLNPKKKMNEDITLIKSFSQFINENIECGLCGTERQDRYAEDTCPECGEEYLRNEYGYSCGCNM